LLLKDKEPIIVDGVVFDEDLGHIGQFQEIEDSFFCEEVES